MKYIANLIIPFIMQAIVTLIIIKAAPGGSFVGLGAMLFALLGIPLTAIINFAMIRSYQQQRAWGHLNRSFRIAMILPALQISLLILASVFRW